jgi:DNA-directed RNA polymerase beta' subunit
MAVHLPLTQEAQDEASEVMITSKNMLNPSN